jgi:hypothetical protein
VVSLFWNDLQQAESLGAIVSFAIYSPSQSTLGKCFSPTAYLTTSFSSSTIDASPNTMMTIPSNAPTSRELVLYVNKSKSNSEPPREPQYIHVILRENKTKPDHPYYKVAVEKYAFRSIVRAKHALLHHFDDVPGTKLTRVTPNPKIRRPEWEFSFSVMKDGVYDGEIWMEKLELFEEISGWYD